MGRISTNLKDLAACKIFRLKNVKWVRVKKLAEESKWSWVGIVINIDKTCIGTNMNTHADKTERIRNQLVTNDTICKIDFNDYLFF